MSKEEIKGLKECKRKAKSGEQVFYMTDKSKMLSIDTPDNYVSSMQSHIEGDKLIEDKDINTIERTVNGHAIMFTRFLKVGQVWGHERRVKSAMTTQNGTIPQLFWTQERSQRSTTRKTTGRSTNQTNMWSLICNQWPIVTSHQ